MLAISQLGQTIRISLDSLPTLKRTSQGVKIMKLEANDLIKNVTLI
jgi:DNA gyrase/topoisomerase IV subunit A